MNFNLTGYRGGLASVPLQTTNQNVAQNRISLQYTTPDNMCCNLRGNGCDMANATIRAGITSIPTPTSGYFGKTDFLSGCTDYQGFAVYFGRMSNGNTDHLSALACKSWLESVDVNITLTRLTSIHPLYPPVTNESSVKFVTNMSLLLEDYEQQGPERASIYPVLDILQPIAYPGPDKYDTFFQALLFGKDAVPASDLLNQTTLTSGVTRLFQDYTAQVLHQLRFDTFTDVVNGTFNTTNLQKVTQTQWVTRVLEALLAIIFVFVLATFWAVPLRFSLPLQPASVLGISMLLVGSKLLTREIILEGAEFWSDYEMREGKIFEGLYLSLGWWSQRRKDVTDNSDTGQGCRYGIGIEGVDDEFPGPGG